MKQNLSETSVKRFCISLLTFSIAVSLLLTGCGSSQTALIANPMEFFERAREEITNADSFRMNGQMVINYGDSSGSRDFRVNYEMFFQQDEDGFLVKMVMEMPAPGVTASMQMIETYITEDKMYLYYPATGQWYYKEFDLGFNIAALDQGLSPNSILKMLDSAKTIEVVEETSSYAKYYLTLDPEKLMNDAELDAYLEGMRKSGIIPFDPVQYREMLKNVTSLMQINLTVDKKSGYPSEFNMVIDEDIVPYMKDFTPNSAALQGASMTMSMNIAISDYGKSFNLSLPEEALQARPFEELTQTMNR